MKINIVPTLIAAAIGLVITYIEYLIFPNTTVNTIIAVAIFQALWFVICFGLSYSTSSKSINIKTLIATFLPIALIANIVFMIVASGCGIVLAVNALLLLICIGIMYAISRSKE